MVRMRETETRISELGIVVNVKEDGTIVVQQGTNVIEWGLGNGHTQMVLDAILTISFSIEKDMYLSSRMKRDQTPEQ